jgi:hypothetical protein
MHKDVSVRVITEAIQETSAGPDPFETMKERANVEPGSGYEGLPDQDQFKSEEVWYENKRLEAVARDFADLIVRG